MVNICHCNPHHCHRYHGVQIEDSFSNPGKDAGWQMEGNAAATKSDAWEDEESRRSIYSIDAVIGFHHVKAASHRQTSCTWGNPVSERKNQNGQCDVAGNQIIAVISIFKNDLPVNNRTRCSISQERDATFKRRRKSRQMQIHFIWNLNKRSRYRYFLF